MDPKHQTRHTQEGKALTLVIIGVLMLAIGVGIGYRLSRGGLNHTGHEHAGVRGGGEEATGDRGSVAGGELKTLYTCGMHPEVISEEPGYCPKCEMKLTPMDPDRARMVLEARGEAVPQATGEPGEREILYWRAPMDPTYIRSEPGKSPMGMELVPVYADEVQGGPSIRIDPVTEQNMGVRYDVVRQGPIEKTVRTVGQVDYDESSLATVTTKIDGWVEQVYIQETGTQVHEGDALFEIYSPELFSAQEEFLVAMRDVERADGRAAELARARLRTARERLSLFDISEEQIERLEETGEISKTLTIKAKNTGIVTHRNVTAGDYLEAGQPAYRIADLSTVWVIGKVYESDLPFIELGQEARMTLDYLPGQTWRGRVTYVYPYLEQGTREVPVRMEFHNPGYELKPGMYATIRLQSRVEDSATLVPSMAMIDTGERQVVFVQRTPGKFEPRLVRTGVRTNQDEFQVLSGLAPGEMVVVSGQFLLDSESRLREATLKMLQPGPQETTDILEEGVEASEELMAIDAYEEAEAGPLKYVCPMPSHAGILYDQPGDCPLCGMKMVPVDPSGVEPYERIDHWTCPMPEHYHVSAQKAGKCPECGMTLIPVTEEEMERFETVESEQAMETLYTCPMPSHAHVVSEEPGRCPECGMKLVPTEAVPHGEHSEMVWHEAQASTQTRTSTGTQAMEMPETLYVCPMESHKHIVAAEPGRCPECNMTLVPTSEVPFGEESEAIWMENRTTTTPEQTGAE